MLEERLYAALERACRASGAPGATAALMRHGQLKWVGSCGHARLHRPQPATHSTAFVLASCSKTATATIVMAFVADGKLSLQAPLSRFYPDLPNAGQITVAQLLGHTSGMAEYTDSPEFVTLSEAMATCTAKFG